MNEELKDWRKFRILFFGIQGLLVALAAHYVLSAGEPEGFFEIFAVPGFAKQYIIQLVALSVLVVVLNVALRKVVAHMYKTRNRRLLKYIVGVIAGAILLTLIFVYTYFHYFEREFDFYLYMNQLWAFLVFFFFFMVVLLVLGYFLENFFRNDVELQVALKEELSIVEGELPLPDETEDREDEEMVEFAYRGKTIKLHRDDISAIVRDDRYIVVYKSNADCFRIRSSISQILELLQGDNRFFATGSWIVHQAAIKMVEDGPSVRSKLLVLHIKCKQKLILPKERVSDFNLWKAQGTIGKPVE